MMLKVNVPTLKVEDLLQFPQDQRLKSDNLHWLLTSIYQRWTKYFRLLEEIEPLRHKYSLFHNLCISKTCSKSENPHWLL